MPFRLQILVNYLGSAKSKPRGANWVTMLGEQRGYANVRWPNCTAGWFGYKTSIDK